MGLKYCYKCGESIPSSSTEYKMYPIEKPYINLFFHVGCYRELGEELTLYLIYNPDKLKSYIFENNAKRNSK